VNNDNSITLEIQQSVESIGTAAVETADIITKKRNINTKVLIDDDEVLVLGGLIRDEVSDTESRIPLLGSIPFIGALFRSNSTATVKKNLMVFIHPKILHDARDNRTASQNRYENIAKGQTRLNDSIRALSSEKLPVLDAYPAIEEIKSSAP
jgi:general secretion pathway protein D